MKPDSRDLRVGIVGLGYVGLPLALRFAKSYSTIGFDISVDRIEELRSDHDSTGEATPQQLAETTLRFTDEASSLSELDFIIVTVPTPIDDNKRPDLRPLESASRLVGQHLKKGSTVIFESTVYPGVTEEVCIPILEESSGLRWKEEFSVGYSPERINPGDRTHTVEKIVKVTSGDTPESATAIDNLYGSIIEAGTFLATSIKVAEAAKVIENCQRDLNIAFVNELSLIFDRVGVDTIDVLEAAGTKWNFLPFRPGLVGGHCIGVDPYYLTYKAEQLGYHPEVILAGRRINDDMGRHVADRTVKMLIARGDRVKASRVLILGFTFKEGVPDIRNTRVVDIVRELEEFAVVCDVWDPVAEKAMTQREYGIDLIDDPESGAYSAVIIAVAHREIKESLSIETVRDWGSNDCAPLLIDLKGILREIPNLESDWSL